MSNHLVGQTSPYLLQHTENPVDWYPWGQEAFDKAAREDKPVFLSIGYSTCHWCHVMAHESFEDEEIAELLNSYFVSIKVDKEERPDIDSIYMAVCQAFTGSGGWPTSIFMTAEQKPFYAGTYFPKTARYGSPGLKELLLAVREAWEKDRASLLRSAQSVIEAIKGNKERPPQADDSLPERAAEQYKRSFDEKYGGFGGAPKFPAPHNLLFLMGQYRKQGGDKLLEMVERTLLQMYRGGLFDHIGGGFCRYSTDMYYLVPHFEKMLYDNALLILAYCEAYRLTGKELYKHVAEKTAAYVLREMTSPEGGFYSAQDADSEGEEGKYYVLTPSEVIAVLGEEDGKAFCDYFNITDEGNFEGKSIPNLLRTEKLTDSFDALLPRLREYRRSRAALETDDKILTFWNSLMIAALCSLYRVTRDKAYLRAAERAWAFIEDGLCEGDTLYVSRREEKRGGKGFIDDYAGCIFALLALYDATYDAKYLRRAEELTDKVTAEYYDFEQGGYFFYGRENETLIARPKESYDGAVPSGNSLMAYNLVRLSLLAPDKKREELLQKQLRFMSGEAGQYPVGYAMFLTALSDYLEPPLMITVVGGSDDLSELPFRLGSDAAVRVLDAPRDGYEALNGETAYYVCKNHSCLPPMNKETFYASLKSV